MGKNYYAVYDKEKKSTGKTIPAEPINAETAPVKASKSINKIAHVADCTCLNVREFPEMTAKVLAVINNGTEVIIDENESTETWCRVQLKNEMRGYAMRKFLCGE